MSIRVTQEKIDAIIQDCKNVLSKKYITIRQFSQLVGKLVATDPGVEHAPLYYKPLEHVRTGQLVAKRGRYDAFMRITLPISIQISWWVNNLSTSYKTISHGKPGLVINSDASLIGYGAAVLGVENEICSGVWSAEEQLLHINILELKACRYALLAFCKDKKDIHVRVNMDNTTSCAYINKYGGRSHMLNSIARDVWFWCIERNIFLSAAHIAGTKNCQADALSRSFNDDLEWSLHEKVFSKIQFIFGNLDIDMFATKLNAQLDLFVARDPEPFACATDAFSMNWDTKFMYLFPPFSLITRVLQKLEQDEGEAVLVGPIWTTQSWWPKLLGLVCQHSFILPPVSKILHLQHKPGVKHPLKKLKLGVFRLSGKPSNSKAYRSRLPISSLSLGEQQPENNIKFISKMAGILR